MAFDKHVVVALKMGEYTELNKKLRKGTINYWLSRSLRRVIVRQKYFVHYIWTWSSVAKPLTPNDHYTGRTAPLTSKRCILYIYSTNIGTEYFKHDTYSPFFLNAVCFSSKCSLFHNSNVFGSCIIHILFTGCAKIKKIIPAPKG